MPLYEYRCPRCGERFEKLVRMSTPASEILCPRCSRPEPERLISAVATVGAACDPRGRFT